MVRSAVRVSLRTRPTSHFPEQNISIDGRSINVNLSHGASASASSNRREAWQFRLDKVLHNASQEQVYDDCAADIVDSVLQGYNGTIMAYGQTGAGKTFTTHGGTESYKYRGLAPRCIGAIFAHIQAKPETAVTARVSYLEIYNEKMFDLLADNGIGSSSLTIMDDASGSVQVKGLAKDVVTCEEDALNLLFLGDTNRAIGEHMMNAQSSRSHTIFTIHLESRSRVEATEKVVTSKLHIVDLAGSERVGKTGSAGLVLKEAGFINKSLTFLEQVVLALGNKNRDHVPFRSSKLTNFLRDSLGGNCKTHLIANVWPEKRNLDETISTLRFATRMMRVQTEAVVNVQMDPMLLIKKQEREIRSLKQELAMHDTLAQRAPQNYSEYSAEEQHSLQNQIQQYCQGEIAEIDVTNLRQINELFRQFKIQLQHARHETAQLRANPALLAAAQQEDDSTAATPQAAHSSVAAEEDDFVGDVDESEGGFSFGQAPQAARPDTLDAANKPQTSPSRADRARDLTCAAGEFDVETGSQPSALGPDEATALADFNESEQGAQLNQAYLASKAQLKDKKRALKDHGNQVNGAKREIDTIQAQLRNKQTERVAQGDAEDVIDEEEYNLISQLKQEKSRYQSSFHQYKMLQSEVAFVKGVVVQKKVTMLDEFLTWYQQQYGTSLTDHDQQETHQQPPHDTQQGEVLDESEKFEQLKIARFIEEDPESVSFYKARRTQRQNLKNRRLQTTTSLRNTVKRR